MAKKHRHLRLALFQWPTQTSRCSGHRMKFFTTLLTAMAMTSFAADPLKPDVPQPCLEKHWLGMHNYLTGLVRQASQKPTLDIYFLGDSITEFWPAHGKQVWAEEFGKLRVLNCGVSGDTTQNILYRITQGGFERISPRVVVLPAGINNLGLSPELKPEDLAKGLQRIVTTIQGKSPASKILLLSIFPCDEVSAPIRNRIRETNKQLAKLGDDKSVFYLDIHDAFLDPAGNFTTAVTLDGTHLNANGYKIWADAMRPTLKKLLEDTASKK
jgi:lysophospholipase L1-like esterase